MDINQREIALGKIFPVGQVLDRRQQTIQLPEATRLQVAVRYYFGSPMV
jgi:hypothetical protein